MVMIAQPPPPPKKKKNTRINQILPASISAVISDTHAIGTAMKTYFFLKTNQNHWKVHFNTEETNLNDYEQMYNWALWTLHETYSAK